MVVCLGMGPVRWVWAAVGGGGRMGGEALWLVDQGGRVDGGIFAPKFQRVIGRVEPVEI